MTITQESVRGDPRDPVLGVGGTFYLSADQDNLVDNTWTQVQLNTTELNVGLTLSSYTVTVSIKGLYWVYGRVHLNDLVTDKRYDMGIYINDSLAATREAHASFTGNMGLDVGKIFLLDKDDTIKLYARSQSGDNTVDITGGSNYTYLSVVLIALK